MNESTASSPNPIITGCGVLKKIKSDSPSWESLQTNHAAPAAKNSHAARLDRGSARAVEPIRGSFQRSSPPSNTRNKPGRRVARKRDIRKYQAGIRWAEQYMKGKRFICHSSL